ncbi:putative tail assembly domain protein, partial [Escherichia coli 1-110-08_S4_C2]
MKQLTVAAVNGGMVRYRSTKAAQQNIARLCRGQGHPVKA